MATNEKLCESCGKVLHKDAKFCNACSFSNWRLGHSTAKRTEVNEMKRTLVIATLCVFLVAAAGTTAAVAKPADTPQAGKSPIYQFDVQPGGKIVINKEKQTFVFTGNGLLPSTNYILQYYVTGRLGAMVIGSGVSNPGGVVVIKGTLNDGQLDTIMNNPGTFYNLQHVL